MKLTCVTATFNCIKAGNRERLIRCVESVAKLKTEHEHLIYDGASSDGTAELLRELERSTPGLKVVSEPDTGIYNALNKGVRDAKGEWFYVLGADDYVSQPEIMDKLIASSGDCEIVHSPVDVGDGKRHGNLDGLKWFFIYNCIAHQGTLMKTMTIMDLDGFDEGNRVSADYDLFFKAHLENKKTRYYNHVYARYGVAGVSSNHDLCERFDFLVLGRYLGLTREQYALRHIASLPLVKLLHFCFHADIVIHTAAIYMVAKRIKWRLKCIAGRAIAVILHGIGLMALQVQGKRE